MTSLAEIRQRIEKGCGRNCPQIIPKHDGTHWLCYDCDEKLKLLAEIEGEMKNVIDNRLSFLSEINNKIDFEAKKVNGLIIIELKELKQKLLGVDTNSQSTKREAQT